MRIVIVGPFPIDCRLVRGGVESSVLGLAKALVESGHEVSVLDLPRKGGKTQEEEQLGIRVFRFANKRRTNLLSVAEVKNYSEKIREIQPDVCHLHNTSAFSYRLYQEVSQSRIKTLLTVHGLARVEQRKKLSKHWNWRTWVKYVYQSYVEKKLLLSGVRIIVDTEYVKEHIAENYQRETTSVHVIPQGVDASYYTIENASRDNRIFSLGAFQPRKGQAVMIRIFADVKKKIPDAKLVLMGAVSDTVYYERVCEEWEKSSYKNDIELHPNADVAEVRKQYEQARLFALYTAEESQGIVFCEAMAAGIPVVSTHVGGVPYIVTDNRCGALSDYGDEEGFVSNIVSLLGDESTEERRDYIRMQAGVYRWSAIAQRIVSVYEQL